MSEVQFLPPPPTQPEAPAAHGPDSASPDEPRREISIRPSAVLGMWAGQTALEEVGRTERARAPNVEMVPRRSWDRPGVDHADGLGVCPRAPCPPDSPITRYELREWPKGSVTVAVEDARSRRTGDPEGLMLMVKTIIRRRSPQGGRLVKSWDAFGEDRRWDRRWNMLPSFFDAEDSLQTAFERAVDDLMAKLARRPSP